MNTLNKTIPPYQRAIVKSHLCSNGIGLKQLDRPLIAVANSWNDIVPGHVHLRQVAEKVKQGILTAGGYPLEFNTIAVCDGIAQGHLGMKYSLPSREIIADSVEIMVRAHGIFDGIVLIASCDKIVPAMLMAAARLNLPAIVVTGGPMTNRITPKESKKARQSFLAGAIDETELVCRTLEYYPGPGICPFLGTANTMCILTEALGMSLPGMALAPANSARAMHLAELSGQRAVELVREQVHPRQILTREALANAITVLAAMGGSLNSVLHLLALGAEAGVPLTLADFHRISSKTPLLTAIVPNSLDHTVKDLEEAGGLKGLMQELRPLLHMDCITVTGRQISEILQEPVPINHKVIRPLKDPLAKEGGIVVLKGSLAPDGALVKVSALTEETRLFRGPARVFNSEEEAIEASHQKLIQEGDVVVVRGEGPIGGPGMRELHRLTEILQQIPSTAVVTDGRFSGATGGLAVGYVSPEAAAGGPIGLVQDGDMVEIDTRQGRLALLVDPEELSRRSIQLEQKEVPAGYLRAYGEQVTTVNRGAVRK
ncbi:MAG: dihydroxy-acid dehydratase [Bacillota bacterium]